MTFKQRFASISFSSPTDAQMQRLFRPVVLTMMTAMYATIQGYGNYNWAIALAGGLYLFNWILRGFYVEDKEVAGTA